jgi:DNA-binding transcriptional LysR family regulator
MSQECDMLDYEDIALVAAVADKGAVRAGAAAARIHAATAYRRLAALERRIGAKLFDKVDGRLWPTPAGEAVVTAAAELGDRLGVLERTLIARGAELDGALSLTTTDTLLPLVMRALPGLTEAYPRLRLSLEISNGNADLSRREADLAVRPTRAPPDHLMGRRIADYGFALYAAPGCEAAPLIGLDESLQAIPAARWLEAHLPEAPRLRVNSLWSAAQACAAGLGRALLPTYIAPLSPPIRAISPPVAELASAVWLLHHPDQRRSAKVRYVSDHLAPRLARLLRPA